MGGFNEAMFVALNGLAGRSWLVDSLIALSLENVFVKAGPIGACFLYAWYSTRAEKPEALRRRILLIALASLFVIAPLTKMLSESRLAPRPFLAAEQTYALEGGRLTQVESVRFRAMHTGDMLERTANLEQGRFDGNDLVTFPSDHAAFFFALALGIFLACRRAGAVALAWTIVVTLATRIAAGMHWPLDIAAGALIGAAVMLLLQLVFAGRRGRLLEPVVSWSYRWPGLGAALLFLLLLEAANTMQTLKRLMEIAASVAERLM